MRVCDVCQLETLRPQITHRYEKTIAISDIVASKAFNHGLPVIDATKDAERLTGLVRSLTEERCPN
jgi:hypothetical protein